MVEYMKKPKYDNLFTPYEGVIPLLDFLPRYWKYWEPTDPGNSNITTVMSDLGYNVRGTHINTGVDFLEDEPGFDYDCIITNPPYSIKDEFLKRAFELDKPFCFLLPITALEGVRRGQMFRQYGIELLVLDRRLVYLSDKKGNWFNSSWFCHDVLPEKLIFTELKK